MANEQNLEKHNFKNLAASVQREIASKGGVAKAEKNRREKTFKELVELYGKCKISDPEMAEKLQQAGLSEEEFTHNMAVVSGQYEKAEKEGNTQAATWVRETKEGKLDNKTSLELSGEVEGITIKVVDYSKGEK